MNNGAPRSKLTTQTDWVFGFSDKILTQGLLLPEVPFPYLKLMMASLFGLLFIFKLNTMKLCSQSHIIYD